MHASVRVCHSVGRSLCRVQGIAPVRLLHAQPVCAGAKDNDYPRQSLFFEPHTHATRNIWVLLSESTKICRHHGTHDTDFITARRNARIASAVLATAIPSVRLLCP